MVERARQGKFLPSTAPFGYDVDFEPSLDDPSRPIRRWVINPVEAEVVRLIHRLYEAMTIRQIALHLNQHVGLRPIKSRTRQGRTYAHVEHAYRVQELAQVRTERAWTRVDVREILSPHGNAEVYAGFVTWGTERRSRHTRGVDAIVHFRPELQIITVEQLNRTKRLLAERATTAPRSVRSPYLFSGLLRCVHCGGAMSGKLTRQPRSRRQVASTSAAVIRTLGRRVAPVNRSRSPRSGGSSPRFSGRCWSGTSPSTTTSVTLRA